MTARTYLAPSDLPPKPDSMTGEPKPPRAPGFHKPEKPSSSTDRETDPSKAPRPPEGQGPVLAWYKASRRGALVLAVWTFVLIFIGVFLLQGLSFRWLTLWWIWPLIAAFALLGYFSRRKTEISAGAEWLQQQGGGWVRIYELTSATAHLRSNTIHLNLKDRDGRQIQISTSDIQEDRPMWDLVYNGLLHSVIAGGAETNGRLHAALDVPRPYPQGQ